MGVLLETLLSSVQYIFVLSLSVFMILGSTSEYGHQVDNKKPNR